MTKIRSVHDFIVFLNTQKVKKALNMRDTKLNWKIVELKGQKLTKTRNI